MGLQPKIKNTSTFITKQCTKCGGRYGDESFSPTTSPFYDGYLPWCNDCIQAYIDTAADGEWSAVDRLCRFADIPFVPNEWKRISDLNEGKAFPAYARVFFSDEFEGLDWKIYYDEFRELEKNGLIRAELPLLDDERKLQLRNKWGPGYADEDMIYLENLFNGLTTTQNINGALQTDQALKICKISLEIDSRIREGSDYDKLLTSYDKLVKIAEFTPKNVKNINDFDSFGEVIKWCEKRGWHNKFYDEVTRDVVDETLKNYQNFVQQLYTNESGIGDEITRRIEALKHVDATENIYGVGIQYDEDADLYEHQGYESLMMGEEFSLDLDGDDDG